MKWLFLVATAWAQEHGAEHAEELVIPWANIGVQALNLTLLLALLAYLLRGSLKQHFANRASEYKELVDRAESAAHEAEKTNRLIKDKMARLEADAKGSEQRAREEAETLRGRLESEAKAISAKIAQEAQRTAIVELEKAKGELRYELLQQAIETSHEKMLKSLGSSDQQKLQNEFAQKIELVNR